MPIIKSAIKKLRQDRKREFVNLTFKKKVKEAVKNFRKNPSVKLYSEMDSLVGRAVKKNIFHKNKASRLKSRLSKLLGVKKPPSIKTSELKKKTPAKKKTK